MGLASKLAAFAARLTSDSKVPQTALAANVAGNGPLVSVNRNSGQTVSNNTTTLLALGSKEWDTSSRFNDTGSVVNGIPAYAFKPDVAGFYQVSFGAYLSSSSSITLNYVEVYKNGAVLPLSLARAASYIYSPTYAWADGSASGSFIIYMNGTTDYLQLYGRGVSGGTLSYNQARLDASLIRSA